LDVLIIQALLSRRVRNKDMEKITITHPRKIEPPQNIPHLYDTMNCEVDDLSQVSDGYHAIDEIYDHRNTLYVALCRMRADIANTLTSEYSKESPEYKSVMPWRCKVHSDGSTITDWFVMGIGQEEGDQISYHLPMSRWDETSFADTLEKAHEWDGHTSADVLERLKTL